MKKSQNIPTLRRTSLAAIGVGLGLLAGLNNARAADKTWDGGGDGSSWSGSPANWDLDIDPVANDRLFFGGTAGLFPNNNFAADTDFAGLTFLFGADPFTISGDEIDLAANSGITNLSLNDQTISANIDNNGANKVHNTFAASMIYSGIVRNNSIIKEGTNSLTLAGSVGNASDGAIINDGTLILAKSTGNAVGAGVTVNTNGTLRIVGPGTDQIHFNQRIIMNGGKFQQQHANGVNTVTPEEFAALSGSHADSIVENGLENSTNRIDIGGGNNHRGIYSGTIRDGSAGVLAFRVYRANNFQQLNGTNTYTGTTAVDNTQNAGAARLIVNGGTGGGAYTVFGSATDATRIGVLNGTGIISASVLNVGANGLLSPGGSLSADLTDAATFSDSTGILTVSNAVNLNTATTSLEVQLNGTTAGAGHDQLIIAGSGSISNNGANLKLTLGYPPSAGDKFTLVQVEGTDSSRTLGNFATVNGIATSLSQGALFVDADTGQSLRISYRAEGSTFDMGAGNGNNIMLEAIAPIGGANLTWRGDVNNNWDIVTSLNWRNGGIASVFTNSDFVTFDDSGSNTPAINLTTDLNPATVLVNSANNYEFVGAGKLTGLVVITKTNTGKLTVTTDNDNVGATLLRQGTIQIGTNGTTGRLSGNINMRTNTTLIFDRSDTTTYAEVISGPGTVVNNGTNGTLILTANSPFTGGIQANAGTLQFGDGTSGQGSILGRVTNNATLAYVYNSAVAINNSISGTGVVNFINTDPASRRFSIGSGPASVTNNTFSGIINVGARVNLATPDQSNGTNQLGIGSTINVEDSGNVLLDRNGIYRTTFNIQGAGNGSGNAGIMTLELEQGTTIVSNVNLLADATIGGFLGDATISGRILGAAGTETLSFANRRQDAQSYNLRIGSAAGPNHWGPTIIEPGDNLNQRIRVTALASRAISTNALTIGAHGIFQLNGFDHTVASLANSGLDGAFLPSVFNGSPTIPAVFSVGTDDTSTPFEGVFGNGGAAALGVTKVGAGTLTLSGSSSNTGPVTLSSGVIALSGEGSFSNSAVINIASGAVLDVTARTDGSLILNSGQTLKGNGGLNGNLVTLPGSIVNPGASIGALTVSNNATLGGTLLLEVDRLSAPNADRLNVAGTLTTGGTLAVTNIGTGLQANDTFPLFSTAVSGFTVSLPTSDILNARTYTWQNDVAVNGSVKVLTSAPIGQPVLTNGTSGNTITFSWAGPFKLQAQTNSLNIGISNNWVNYPGGSISPISVTINPTNPAVFFRLSL